MPFRAESLLGVLNQHVQTPPKPLGEVAPGRVSPELARVVERMLAKDPAARFQTMDEVTHALSDAARAGREPTPAVPHEAVSLPVARMSLKKWWPVPAVLVVAAIAGIVWRAKTHAVPAKGADATPAAPTPIAATPTPKLIESPPSAAAPKPKLGRHKKLEATDAPTTTTSTASATTGVDRLAASLAPHGGRIGPLVDGHGEHAGDHTDFTTPLHAGRCYTILAIGKPGVISLALALADPHGHSVAEQSKFTATPSLKYCATASGSFKVQAKLARRLGRLHRRRLRSLIGASRHLPAAARARGRARRPAPRSRRWPRSRSTRSMGTEDCVHSSFAAPKPPK